ncbi:MAG: class I SAM-dependent methyltransferase [Propylenella sp.]
MERIQTHVSTALFRNMGHYRTAACRLAATRPNGGLRILSFGCSMGDEIATLASLFPTAQIHACDVNAAALDIARRNASSVPRVSIFAANEDEIARRGPFDLIAAMSVLCRNPPTELMQRFPPTKFDEVLGLLDTALSPGGLLVLFNTSYRFQETPVAQRYRPLRSDVVDSSGFVDVFDRAGEPFLSMVMSQAQYAPFRRKGPAFSIADAEEIADSVFEKYADLDTHPIWVTVSPPPASFEERFRYRKSNVDGATAKEREGAIEVQRILRIGRDLDTGAEGAIVEVVWPRLLKEGPYRRPPFWMPLSAASI